MLTYFQEPKNSKKNPILDIKSTEVDVLVKSYVLKF